MEWLVLYPHDGGDQFLPRPVMPRNAAGDRFLHGEGFRCLSRHQFAYAKTFATRRVIKFDAGGFDGIDFGYGFGVMLECASAGPAKKNARQGSKLFWNGLVIDVKNHAPRLTGLLVVIAAGERYTQAAQIDGSEVAILNHPR